VRLALGCAEGRTVDLDGRALYASLADRSSRKLLDRLARVPLLCIDEMGYLTLRPEQSNIFFKLMEERYRRRASII
jgi:DNA replication protein DnaC